MPELPEVETMRRGILAVVGRRIASIDRPPCRRRPIAVVPSWPTFRRRAVGATVTAVDRIGKRVVVRLDTRDSIVLEPRMTGLVLLTEPPTREHLRWVATLEGARPGPEQLLYWDRRGLGSVRLLDEEACRRAFESGRIGPDALAISAEQLAERLGKSRRAIKVALLDQAALAGVGNLYASEILFLARVHPETPCTQLRMTHWEDIHRRMREVLELAIRYEGSTLGDGTYRNALNQQGGYQNHHRVYDRADEPCSVCRETIVRIVQAQRSTFFCPRCQAAERRGRRVRHGAG